MNERTVIAEQTKASGLRADHRHLDTGLERQRLAVVLQQYKALKRRLVSDLVVVVRRDVVGAVLGPLDVLDAIKTTRGKKVHERAPRGLRNGSLGDQPLRDAVWSSTVSHTYEYVYTHRPEYSLSRSQRILGQIVR